MRTVEEKEKLRFQMLHKIYEISGGNKLHTVNFVEIGESLGLTRDEAFETAQYLNDEYLVKFFGSNVVVIEHDGIKEVEEALKNPNQPTEHFPAFATINVNVIGSMTNSQINQASSNSTQNITVNVDNLENLKGIVNLLEQLVSQNIQLQESKKSELKAELDTLKAQVSSPRPKLSIITESICTVSEILQIIATNPLASQILNNIGMLIKPS